jgi:hypothetical protein
MNQKGLTTLHIVEQQEVKIKIEKGNWKYVLTSEFIQWNGWS